VAYDTAFADRVRTLLDGVAGLRELSMFGGIGWTVHGNMALGTLGDVLICRLGPEAEALLDEPGADVFDLTGRVMKGWLTVAIEALGSDESLQEWVDRGVQFASSLPAKPGK
jgi:TfoX/Sxy family transcriptional regulator of competence genes